MLSYFFLPENEQIVIAYRTTSGYAGDDSKILIKGRNLMYAKANEQSQTKIAANVEVVERFANVVSNYRISLQERPGERGPSLESRLQNGDIQNDVTQIISMLLEGGLEPSTTNVLNVLDLAYSAPEDEIFKDQQIIDTVTTIIQSMWREYGIQLAAQFQQFSRTTSKNTAKTGNYTPLLRKTSLGYREGASSGKQELSHSDSDLEHRVMGLYRTLQEVNDNLQGLKQEFTTQSQKLSRQINELQEGIHAT